MTPRRANDVFALIGAEDARGAFSILQVDVFWWNIDHLVDWKMLLIGGGDHHAIAIDIEGGSAMHQFVVNERQTVCQYGLSLVLPVKQNAQYAHWLATALAVFQNG